MVTATKAPANRADDMVPTVRGGFRHQGISEREEDENRGKCELSINNSIYREPTQTNPRNPYDPSLTRMSQYGNPGIHVKNSNPRPSSSNNPNVHLSPQFKINDSHSNYSNPWIFDCGATKSMTFDPGDLLYYNPTTHTKTGDCVHVDGEGPIAISLSLQLKNGFLILNLSYKLLSISELTKELINCIVPMTTHGCIVQDTQTQKTICHGTECGGLYYLDYAGLVLMGSSIS